MQQYRGIAFTGIAKSGKTTCANYLAENYEGRVLSFAEELKKELAEGLCGGALSSYNNHLTNMKTPGKKEIYRSLLQSWGDFRRKTDPEHWIHKVEDKIGLYAKRKHPILLLIDDLRYINEYIFLKKQNFYVVKVASIRENVGLKGQEATHASELEIQQITPDEIIYNNDSLDCLHEQLNIKLRELNLCGVSFK